MGPRTERRRLRSDERRGFQWRAPLFDASCRVIAQLKISGASFSDGRCGGHTWAIFQPQRKTFIQTFLGGRVLKIRKRRYLRIFFAT